jgi:dihydrofolate synthase/folylpolyglutamate synthase
MPRAAAEPTRDDRAPGKKSVTCDLLEPPLNPGSVLSAYDEALRYLYARINYERCSQDQMSSADFKLDRMRELLRRLGDPQERLPVVHVAGTKGKGSTAAMIACRLRSAGYRVGLFTSPHLYRFEERMLVNGRGPDTERVAALVDDVRRACENMERIGPQWSPTFFETTTAMAWRYFEQSGAEIAVLEVGLGGRLDATNVCRPVVTLITSISLDHTQLLGTTHAQIAREKAGIIKPGVPLLSAARSDEARRAIRQVALDRDAPLYELGDQLVLTHLSPDSAADPDLPRHWSFALSTPWRRHPCVRAPLAGAHQAENTALAVAALDVLNRGPFPNDAAGDSRWDGLHWPLRIEVLRRRPLLIVDAAHNDASLAALVSALRGIPAGRRRLVFGTSRDKDARAMLLQVRGAFDEVVLTQYTSNPRALPVDDLQRIADGLGIVSRRSTASPQSAWRDTVAASGPDDLVCVTGSFFLAAEVREAVLRNDAG